MMSKGRYTDERSYTFVFVQLYRKYTRKNIRACLAWFELMCLDSLKLESVIAMLIRIAGLVPVAQIRFPVLYWFISDAIVVSLIAHKAAMQYENGN